MPLVPLISIDIAHRLPEHSQRAQHGARLGARTLQVVLRQLLRYLDPLHKSAHTRESLRTGMSLSLSPLSAAR